MLQDIKVGDILEVKDEQVLPADCILLKTEKPDGLAYVETSALDGERNLKPRFAPMEIQLGFTEIFGLVNKK